MIEVTRSQGRATVAQLTELGREMFEESSFSILGFDQAKAQDYAHGLVYNSNYISVCAFEGQKLVGFCVGVCGAVLPFTTARVAMQHYLYLSPGYRGGIVAIEMIQTFLTEAKIRGARKIVFSNGTGYEPERVERLFQHCGLTRVGGIYEFKE